MTIPKLSYKPVDEEKNTPRTPPRRRKPCLIVMLLFCLVAVLAVVAVFLLKVATPTGICGNSLHASCKIKWTFDLPCPTVRNTVVGQIKKWTGPENCKDGGQKCLYQLTSLPPNGIKATHTTPKKKYVDDLTFTFTSQGQSCQVQGYSTSEVWYAILDYGTNYCNLHNLITGSGLDAAPGYREDTSNRVCTQYTSANCQKY